MRTTLTYRPTSFKRAKIAGCIAVPCIIVFLISHHSDHVASLNQTYPILTIPTIMAAIGLFFSAGIAISEVIFVLSHRNPSRIFEFDEHNLYISEDGMETTIPFVSINEIHLSLRNTNNSIRYYAPYLIRYTTDGLDDEVTIKIYRQKAVDFEQFSDWVQCDNPSAKRVNWTYTGEDFMWRRKRRK